MTWLLALSGGCILLTTWLHVLYTDTTPDLELLRYWGACLTAIFAS